MHLRSIQHVLLQHASQAGCHHGCHNLPEGTPALLGAGCLLHTPVFAGHQLAIMQRTNFPSALFRAELRYSTNKLAASLAFKLPPPICIARPGLAAASPAATTASDNTTTMPSSVLPQQIEGSRVKPHRCKPFTESNHMPAGCLDCPFARLAYCTTTLYWPTVQNTAIHYRITPDYTAHLSGRQHF